MTNHIAARCFLLKREKGIHQNQKIKNTAFRGGVGPAGGKPGWLFAHEQPQAMGLKNNQKDD